MLTITANADQALDAVVSAEDAPEGAGVRISQAVGVNGRPTMGLSLAPAPEEGDQVVEEASVPVFLAPEVAEALDDKVLDAQIEDGRVAFQIADQPS